MLFRCLKTFICFVFFSGFFLVEVKAFIPRSVQKVCVLDFSGKDESGIRFTSLLRESLGEEGFFVITGEKTLEKLEKHYTYLFENDFDRKIITDIGKILNVDAVMVGHIRLLDISQNIQEFDGRPKLNASASFIFIWKMYDAKKGHLIEERVFDIHEVFPNSSISFLKDPEIKKIENKLFGLGIKKIEKYIEDVRSKFILHSKRSFKITPASKPLSQKPLKLDLQKVYKGLMAPEKVTKVFERGDTFWFNLTVDNLAQTFQGEVWLEIHGSVLNPNSDVILDLSHWFDKRMVLPPLDHKGKIPRDKDPRSLPITLSFKIKENMPRGRYKLFFNVVDRVVARSISNEIDFKIK
ncbi:hypothetical protein AB834_01960 [PVC group bacterium (ex Bugula neritina AB1)]|nr:hypothetical protein AB834_01960 [PVC group bacterium (ex Bugula neritina AB1)]